MLRVWSKNPRQATLSNSSSSTLVPAGMIALIVALFVLHLHGMDAMHGYPQQEGNYLSIRR